MKVKYITSACIEIEYSDGYRILCDPWLTEGIYYGTWFHNPPLKNDWIDYFNRNPPDALYISHIHQDHCDIATLEKFTFKCPIFIANFNDKALGKLLGGLYWPVLDSYMLADDKIRIWTADGLECDSFALFRDRGIYAVNFNDCVYPDVKDQIREIFQMSIDLAMLPYSGASCFPQCFDSLSHEEKIHEKNNVCQKYLNWYYKYRKDLDPMYTLPVAGQYKLKDEKLNQYLAIPDLPQDSLIPEEGKEYYIGIEKLICEARLKMLNHYKGTTQLYIQTENRSYVVLDRHPSDNILTIKLPEKLLWEVLTKRKHWNNAELGNLLRFDRKGDYDKELHYCFSYFHI